MDKQARDLVAALLTLSEGVEAIHADLVELVKGRENIDELPERLEPTMKRFEDMKIALSKLAR